MNTALQQKELNTDLVSKSEEYILIAMEEIRKLSKAPGTADFIGPGLKQSIGDLIDNILLTGKIQIVSDLEALDKAGNKLLQGRFKQSFSKIGGFMLLFTVVFSKRKSS